MVKRSMYDTNFATSQIKGQTNVKRDQNLTAANQNQRNGPLLHYVMYYVWLV